jgi:steroid delta-isomerase-like uncharacterized protein
MPEKNEAVVRRLMEDVWSKGNLKLIDEVLATDYVDHDPMDTTRGPDGARELVTKYRAAFPDCRIDIDEIFSTGDRVVVRFQYSGTHKNNFEGIPATGRRVRGPGIAIHRFVGDRIKESYTNWDALGLMTQLGVVTLPGNKFKAGA